MSVALKKLPGVEAVNVSLNEGSAELKLKDGNKLNLDDVREAIRKNGFTPKEAQVKAVGTLVERNGKPALEVTGTDLVYLLEGDTSQAKASIGKKVVVSGQVPEAADKNAPRVLVVKELSREPK